MIKSLKEDSFIHGTSNESNLLGVIDPNVQRKNEYRKIFEDKEICLLYTSPSPRD